MIHLHNHSHYSTLDGLMKIEEMIDRAKEIGSPAISVNDHGSISALPEFYKKCNAAGVKPIIGCEFYCVLNAEGSKGEKRYHLNVMAKNWAGVQSIMHMLTIAGRQFYIRPRITLEQALEFHDCVVTTACCMGPMAIDDLYSDYATRLKATYGEDLYFEIMPHVIVDDKEGIDIQKRSNVRAMEMSAVLGVKMVATNDAHFAKKEDASTHDVLLAIQTGRTLNDPYRWKMGDFFYLKSDEEMIEAFKRETPYIIEAVYLDAMQTTYEIADKCNVVMPKFEINLPNPYTEDDETMFGQRLVEGWHKKILTKVHPELHSAYQKRLLYEIEVIRDKDFVRYFLIVEDMIRWSRENGIMVGPARGSSCGSLVCYLLDITQIDPIKWGLFFERFLNPERTDYPDIDVDVQDDRRSDVIQYVRNKYGKDKTAMISTFSFLGAKSAFRDVCRVFGIEMKDVNKLSKSIEPGTIANEFGEVTGTYTDVEAFEHVPELANFAANYPGVVEQIKRLDGTIRQMGVHAAGVVVASKPLDECAAVMSRNDVDAVCWDKRTCEDPFGLIKMDLLGLSTLSVLNMAKRLIRENHGVDIEFTEIPMEDEPTLEEFRQGRGIAVFQFENSGAQGLLRALGLKTYREVCDVTALFRPGSLESGETERYKKIAQGDEYETYDCPELKPILGDTRGVLVYQEQMMKIFVALGGFTFAESDKMRKIVGKKLGADEFNKHRQHFVDGCVANGISESAAMTIFSKMVSFANYSFNLSHAIAYSHLSWWSMYLKVHYPAEYMCAMLSKTTKDDKLPKYIKEAIRMGIRVHMPSINESHGTEYTIVNGEILAPLSCIKGIGEKVVDHIIEVRNAGGPFKSTIDFERRVEKRKANVRVRATLFKADAFLCLGEYELDDNERVMNLKSLLDIFETLPQFNLDAKREPVDLDALKALLGEAQACSMENRGSLIVPVAHKKPSIMVVNNPTQFEDRNLKSPATKYVIEALDALGIKISKIHYTNAMKCQWGKATPPKVCAECQERFLKREIEIVDPDLIVVAASGYGKWFGFDSNKAADISGQVIFNSELERYVIFTYSPQYAKYNPTANEGFEEAMKTVGKIFGKVTEETSDTEVE